LTELKSRLGIACENYIERLSNYVASSGKQYKSHYATILNWAQKDKPKNVCDQTEQTASYDLEEYEGNYDISDEIARYSVKQSDVK